MSVAATAELPPQVAWRLAEFCDAAKTGTLQLDIKDGHVVGYKLTESGRVDVRRQ